MSKKILYVWKSEYPWDVRVEKICNSLFDSGYNVFLACRWGGEPQQNEILNGVNIRRVGFGKKRIFFEPLPINPFWSNELEKLIEEIKPDLIICREIMLSEISGKLAKKYNIPVLMDMAENYPAAMKLWKKYNDSFIWKTLIHHFKVADSNEKRGVRLMDGIITVCNEQNERLQNQYNFNQNEMKAIHNTPTYKNEYLPLTSKNKIVFSHHGFLTGDKSIAIFLKGFLLACDELDIVEFRIIGDGDCFDEYNSLVNNSNHINKVKFLGKYNFEDLGKHLSDIDIGVLPYEINDFNNYTIHNKIFDYFAFSKPVLVSEALPLKRIISETESGFCYDLNTPEKVKEALISIAKLNLEEYSKKAYNAYKIKYNWSCDKQNLVEFIEKYI